MDDEILTDRVQEPKEGENGSGDGIRLFEIGAEVARGRPSWADKDPPNVEEGEVAKDVEAPLV